MDALHKLENQLAGLFKDTPKLSASSKETLASVWPWLALVFGILQLLAAWALWGLVQVAERATDLANSISLYYTGTQVGLTAMDKNIIYLSLIVLVVDAVILLMAFPELKKRTKRGWDLVFLGAVLNIVYSVLTIFIDGRGLGSFLFNLIGIFIGLYLLFQVREKFGKSASAAK